MGQAGKPATWRFMLLGGVGAGKTTLIRTLEGAGRAARKTQMVEYAGWAIDTPGEYAERGGFRGHLAATAGDAQLLVAVQDAGRPASNFPPLYFTQFTRPVIGVVTKIDAPGADVGRATALLRAAGVRGEVFPVSAITGSGLSELRHCLLTLRSVWKEQAHGERPR
jgi:ethanolamine utilization protein EutP